MSQDTASLRTHLEALCLGPSRNYQNPFRLDEVAEYIENQFKASGARIDIQDYQVGGTTYRNVIGSFGPEEGPRIVVGAHYDVAGEQQGADDNASGVVGLIELAKRFQAQAPDKRIDLVAYSLEEPPFFRSEEMGSYVHVKSLEDAGIEVEGMVCLEMIGYFKDEKGSQGFPVSAMKLFYGSRGDFIATVRKFGEGKFSRRFHRKFKKASDVRVKTLKGPTWIPGVDFSDHQWYWKAGISAVMITDTAFYRNHNYHEQSDTIESLDLDRMGQVIEAVGDVLLAW